MLIAALSDTHIPDKAHSLPNALIERLRTVDLILHAGDFTSLDALNLIKSLAPTEAVYGNVDDWSLKEALPRKRTVTVDGYRIGLVHGDGHGRSTIDIARRTFNEVDCIVFGHSHFPVLETYDSVLMLNPGSPTDKRRAPRPSFGLISITDKLEAELIYL